MNIFEKLVRTSIVAAMAVSVTSAYAADQTRAQDRLQTDMVEEPDRDRDRLRVDKDLQEPANDMKKEQYQIRNQNMNRENTQTRPNPSPGSSMRQK